jgi:energy-coupling factor transporter ATP-binding protein EcfA2
MRFFNFNKSLFTRKHIFDDISGYEEEKWVLEQALNNDEPTHILLVGPPGIGKTRFLKAIEKLYPDMSYFALASGSTGASSFAVFPNIIQPADAPFAGAWFNFGYFAYLFGVVGIGMTMIYRYFEHTLDTTERQAQNDNEKQKLVNDCISYLQILITL